MANPFEKRATEYLRDDEAFLAVVTPEPLATFFETPAREDRLYDRLAIIIGTPGSGKTTIARLFQFPTLMTMLRNQTLDIYKNLIDALTLCGAIKDSMPTLVAARIPMETEYREFWEFPYPDDVKMRLMITLLQARAVLGWLRSLQTAGIKLEQVKIVPKADAQASVTGIGDIDGQSLLSRARIVELAIYKIAASLVPPELEAINSDSLAAYRPFDVIESFQIVYEQSVLSLRPLVIFDDAHTLHPTQFLNLQKWLMRRELKVSRWILTRMDALSASDVLIGEQGNSTEPGIKRAREITDIWLQSPGERASQRKKFRKMAKDMANRYLSQMEIFRKRAISDLSSFLLLQPENIAPGKMKELNERVNTVQRRHRISQKRRNEIEAEVDRYLGSEKIHEEDLRAAMIRILMERYAKRTPQRALFEETPQDIDPVKPLNADSEIADGARLHLLHEFGRPFFFGLDNLCDASSENAEQFLQLTARLIAQSETQLIRGKGPTLNSTIQNKLLRQRAEEIIRQWDFPHHHAVRSLASSIAAQCLAKSCEPNASLGAGACAFGVPQEEFDAIAIRNPNLAKILQFGVAYNAFTLVPQHKTKNRLWCLVELGGIVLLANGLTLKRGGFLERNVEDLKLLATGERQ